MFFQKVAHWSRKNETGDEEIQEEGEKKGVSMERSKAGAKKRRPYRLTIAQAYRLAGSLRTEAVDEYRQTNLHP